MRLKVVYTTLVEQQQQGSGTSGQANASASTSSFATGSNDSNSSNQQMRRTYVARGGITNQASALNGSAGQRYGQTTLKACMGLICYSRPDLIPNSRLDYAVSVLDVRETDDLGLTGSDRIWEGKGMMSWLLHEKGPGQKVIGRIVPNHQCDDDDQGTTDDGDRQLEQEKRFMLEVSIELMPRTPLLRKDLVQSLASCGDTIQAALQQSSSSSSSHSITSQQSSSAPAQLLAAAAEAAPAAFPSAPPQKQSVNGSRRKSTTSTRGGSVSATNSPALAAANSAARQLATILQALQSQGQTLDASQTVAVLNALMQSAPAPDSSAAAMVTSTASTSSSTSAVCGALNRGASYPGHEQHSRLLPGFTSPDLDLSSSASASTTSRATGARAATSKPRSRKSVASANASSSAAGKGQKAPGQQRASEAQGHSEADQIDNDADRMLTSHGDMLGSDLSPATNDVLGRLTSALAACAPSSSSGHPSGNFLLSSLQRFQRQQSQQIDLTSSAASEPDNRRSHSAEPVFSHHKRTISLVDSITGDDEAQAQSSLAVQRQPASVSQSKASCAGNPTSAGKARKSKVPPVRYWAPGCLKCKRTASTGWRVRKKRQTPLDGTMPSAMVNEDMETVKKLCEECAQDLPSVKKRKMEEEEQQQQRNSSAQTKTPAPFEDVRPLAANRHAQARTIHSVQTSPLRRSPRRHASSTSQASSFKIEEAKHPSTRAGHSGVAMTSPTSGPSHALGGPRKRKFTTALSKAALVEEAKNKADGDPMEVDLDLAAEPLSNSFLSVTQSPERHRAPFIRGHSSPPKIPANDRKGEDSSLGSMFDFSIDPASDLPEDFDLSAYSDMGPLDMDFLMNASPGTAIRSVLGRTGDHSRNNPSFPDSPTSLMNKYLATLSPARPKRDSMSDCSQMNLDIPSFSSLHSVPSNAEHERGGDHTAQEDDDNRPRPPTLSPGSLSTPFRKAIFSRSASEQPPASISRLQNASNGAGLLSSEEGGAMGSMLSTLQIKLQPPTADRRLALQAAQARHALVAGDDQHSLASSMRKASGGLGGDDGDPASDSLAILNDFSSFLLKTGSSLYSPSPPRSAVASKVFVDVPSEDGVKGASNGSGLMPASGKPSLAPLHFPALANRRRSSAPMSFASSSDLIDPELMSDLRDLPPSSPPPLPQPSERQQLSTQNHASGRQGASYLRNPYDYLSSHGPVAGGFDDGLSPISVTTTVTNGGTPQEALTVPSGATPLASSSSMEAAASAPAEPTTKIHQTHARTAPSFDKQASSLGTQQNLNNNEAGSTVQEQYGASTCELDFTEWGIDFQAAATAGSSLASTPADFQLTDLRHANQTFATMGAESRNGPDPAVGSYDGALDPLLEFFGAKANGGTNAQHWRTSDHHLINEDHEASSRKHSTDSKETFSTSGTNMPKTGISSVDVGQTWSESSNGISVSSGNLYSCPSSSSTRSFSASMGWATDNQEQARDATKSTNHSPSGSHVADEDVFLS